MIIDVFTYSDASPNAAFSVEVLIEAALRAGLDGICVTDKGVSSHAQKLVAAGQKAGFFVGVGVEIDTAAGRVTAFPKTLGADFVSESWKSLGETPRPEDVLSFFHERGGIVVARDVFNCGHGLRDRVHAIRDAAGAGFDAVDTLSSSRRRIDNELSMEAQNVLGVTACAGSGVFDDIQSIGCCATLFAQKIRSQADFVDAMKGEKHWACTLRDIGEACPMGTPPRMEGEREERGPSRGRDERRQGRGRDDKRRDARGHRGDGKTSGGHDRRSHGMREGRQDKHAHSRRPGNSRS